MPREMEARRAEHILHNATTVRICIVVCLLVAPAFAFAQDTREAEIAALQREKAAHLAPHRPHWAEELLLQVRQTLVEQPSGFYPYFDSVYSGGGFTLGEGYRQLHRRSHALEHRRFVFNQRATS